MNLSSQIQEFINHPFPLWQPNITQQLVQYKCKELEEIGLSSFRDYSTVGYLLGNSDFGINKKESINGSALCIELPSSQLQSFYDAHGLELLTKNEIQKNSSTLKLRNAITVLQSIEPVYKCITEFVSSIQILRQSDPEIDLSYSHPDIPFSIFVSVCKEDSMTSNLRVAESILHEAMHLKLSLIEKKVPLVKPDTDSLYYSPWRDELRPAWGVLHGMFVFKAIKDFYNLLLAENYLNCDQENNFIKHRIEAIQYQLQLLNDFHKSEGLTHFGKELVRKLLN